jgi:hypothetical protein
MTIKYNITAREPYTGKWLKLSYPTLKEAKLHNPELKNFRFIEELNGDANDNTKNRNV